MLMMGLLGNQLQKFLGRSFVLVNTIMHIERNIKAKLAAVLLWRFDRERGEGEMIRVDFNFLRCLLYFYLYDRNCAQFTSHRFHCQRKTPGQQEFMIGTR